MDAPEPVETQRSTRDLDQTRQLLELWLATQLPPDAAPTISELTSPAANGMSSETLLLDAQWAEEGARRSRALVARVAPEESAVPVFPTYDLHRQFEVIRTVGERTTVPVPQVLWSESVGSAIGSPFFVMERIDGIVPPDMMPYTFGDNWLFDATPADQARLQDSSVAVLAELHQIEDATTTFASLAPGGLRVQIDAQRAFYEWAVEGTRRLPLIERMFAWLEAHWPAHEGPTVLSWGDSRIGNIMYRDFTPVAVLDWEMAALGPPEIDVAWMTFMHIVFEDLAATFGLSGMPEFMRPDDVLGRYEALTAYAPRDTDFYLMYAALRWGIVSIRTQLRQIHFGGATYPDDPDDLIMTRSLLERMVG
ncbi:MAG: phosphotransferase family protein [Acidimicrobiales bacterium]